jgi:hypothetical protein
MFLRDARYNPEHSNNEVFHHARFPPVWFEFVILDVSEATKGRFVSSFYCPFPLPSSALFSSIYFITFSNSYYFPLFFLLYLFPHFVNHLPPLLPLFFANFPFPLYFLRISPSFILYLLLSSPFPILIFLPFFLLSFQCPVQGLKGL